MKKLISRSVLDKANDIGDQFVANKPFQHAVVDNFFKKNFCEQLLEEFPTFNENLAMNENGVVGRKSVHEKLSQLGSSYEILDGLVQSKEFLQFMEKLTGIDDLVFDPYYFGGGTHHSLNGQDLDPHVDFTHHPISGYHRRINLIVYLNKEWKKEWGGNIELHKNPRFEPHLDEITSIEPLFNRMVVFETNNISWHGFPKIDLPDNKKNISRKSIALYYYTKNRSQPIAPHSTIYVERHLPAHIQQGVSLTACDLQDIKVLLARRDQHLQRLYSYITQNTEIIDNLKAQIEQLSTQNNEVDIEAGEQSSPNMSMLSARVKELENSTSWKMTAPLRSLARVIKKIG